VHLGTCITHQGSSGHNASGQTLWGSEWRDAEAGLAWDWILIGNGVIAMADPMCIISNMRLLGQQGEVLTGYEAALHYNQLVHRLRWQDEVWRAIQVA
jgi:hypothetical protein